jgi:Tol biopolymer transport system component/DNA-binding winged helix-turn-helix (wHTH) protein
MQPAPACKCIRFGVFELDVVGHELRKHGVKLRLQNQPFQVLTILLERPGELVSREELRKRVWPAETFVDFDHSLNTAINKIRNALGDPAATPRFIGTEQRIGYRFIAPVQQLMESVSAPAQQQAAPTPDVAEYAHKTLATGSEPVHKNGGISLALIRRRLVLIASLVTLASLVFASAMVWIHYPGRTEPPRWLDPVPLTSLRGEEVFPTFSPDGRQVAFSWNGEQGDQEHIYIKLVGSGDPVRLTRHSGREYAPAWSPRGDSIAFLRESDSGMAAVATVSALGGSERQISGPFIHTVGLLGDARGAAYGRDLPGPYLAWSPKSDWLAVADKQSAGGPSRISMIKVDTGEIRSLTDPSPTIMGDSSPAFAPSGRTLAFTRTAGLAVNDIFLLSLSPDLRPVGEPKRLTFDNRQIHGLAWTGDGREIVFSSNRGTKQALWRTAIAGHARPQRLVAAGEDAYDVAISSDGHRLVYTKEISDRDIYRIPLTGDGKALSGSAKFMASTMIDYEAQYSPDGENIAFCSNRSGHEEVWIADKDGLNPTRFTFFDGPPAGSPRWSPDGKMIAFDCNSTGNWDIYVSNLQPGEPVRMTRNSGNNVVPSWSADGRWIYFASNRTGRFEVWKTSFSGKDSVQITRNGGFAAAESPDGRWLLYTRSDHASSVWRMPVSGGQDQQVLPSIIGRNFVIARHGIYFLAAAKPGKASIEFLDATTGRVSRVAPVQKVFLGLSVSPDERYLLYTQVNEPGGDLMLLENFR